MRRKCKKKMMNMALEISLFILRNVFYMPQRKIVGHGADFLSEGQSRPTADFYRRSKSIPSAGFEPANLGLNVKLAEYYTTKATGIIP
jgi:hypothetical protein